jgi:hypothetical protein
VKHDALVRLDPGLTIRVVEVERRCGPEIERRVDEVWQRLKAERPGELYDGSVATLENASASEIQVGRAPFRYFAAQSADAVVREALDLWCVGVSGVTTAADRLLFGRRGAVTHYRGQWELLPSGHLPVEGPPGTRLDPVGHLLDELHEEVGVPRERVMSTVPLALVPDTAIRVSEVFIGLELDHSRVELDALIARPPNDEYDALVALARDEVPGFVRRHSTRLLDSTLAMLRELGHAS